MKIKVKIDRNGYVGFLCRRFYCTKYMEDWECFWGDINTRNKCTVSYYFKHDPSDFELGLLRLLIVEDFKQYLKEKR